MTALTKPVIHALFAALDVELAGRGIVGELYLVGGAVMCLAFDARASTVDVDALFRPTREVREAAARVGEAHALPATWLNDAVTGYLSPRGRYDVYLDRPHLKVFVATAEYLLAMKALSMRLGAEFHDESDVRFLLRSLNITSTKAALDLIEEFYPIEQLLPKTTLALQEILGD